MDPIQLKTSYNSYFDKTTPSLELKTINFNTYILTKANITELLNEITRLRTQIAELTVEQVRDKHTVISYFKYSLLIYGLYNTLHKSSKYPSSIIEPRTDDGLLNKTSGNCLHTMLTLKHAADEKRKFNLFVKLVDYEKNNNPDEKTDNILFDIINGQCFKLMNSSSASSELKFRKHLALYRYSFLSYYSVMADEDDKSKPLKNYWNYNKLLYEYDSSDVDNVTQLYSPYHPSNEEITKILTTTNSDSLKPAFIYMCDSVKHVNLYRFLHQLDPNYRDNLSKIENVFKELFFNFFKFLLELGIIYGFHHNDLHSVNLIYNLQQNEITMIDFGRSCFASLLTSDNEVLNRILQEKLTTLNFKDDTKIKATYASISTYKDLFDVSKDLLIDFVYVDAYKKTSGDEPYYPMIIFDHMTLVLIMYSKFIRYLKHTKDTNIDEFLDNFKNLLEFTQDDSSKDYQNYTINNDSRNTKQLLDNYSATIAYLNTIKTSERHSLKPFINSLKIIADGLLLIALLELHFGNTDNTHSSAIDYETHIVILNIKQKNNFIKNSLLCHYVIYKSVFTDNDHFLIYILKDKSFEEFSSFENVALTTGGKKYKKKAGLITLQQKPIEPSEFVKQQEPRFVKDAPVLQESTNASTKASTEASTEEFKEEFKESEESFNDLNDCYINTYNVKEKLKNIIIANLQIRKINPEKELSEELSAELSEGLSEQLLAEWNNWIIYEQKPEIKAGNKKVINRKIRRLKKYN